MEIKYEFGLIGLAVMGQNFALNIESSGHRLAVYNRSHNRLNGFMEQRAEDKNIEACYSLEELVDSLEKPRKIMMLVKAGNPVDSVIDKLIPLLDKGDIIIDGGNSFFKDTERRYNKLKDLGIRFLGAGVSGGEYGALHGPSIMPGGDQSAYDELKAIFEDAAASTDTGPCVAFLGPGSAGHYVKMVHNGIEYAVMAIITEIYDFMRKVLKLSPDQMAEYFAEWNQVENSYLLEITAEILKRKDEVTGEYLIDQILDTARQKGTGKWSAQEALELGVPVPTITAAVNSRSLSALKNDRVEISKDIGGLNDITVDEADVYRKLETAISMATLISYAEGFKLLEEASAEYDYSLDLSEVARIWEDGCIIRSSLLKPIQAAYKGEKILNLIAASQFRGELKDSAGALREVVSMAQEAGIPVPALSSALSYYDILRTAEMPTNLIQAQRDYFGAHTYQRRDEEGIFHTEWQEIKNI